MIIYGSSISPYVRKTLAAAAEKGIAVENKVSAPGNPDPDFVACSPFKKIPAMRDGDFTICDSSAIIHYMEALQPQPALIPAEAKARAKVIWYEEFADTIVVAAGGKMFFNRVVAPKFMGRPGDEEVAAKAEREELPPVMDYLESIAPEPGRFLVGDTITLADLAIASPFVNFRHMDTDLSRWPRAMAYVNAILARPSFAPLIETENRIFGRAA
jgi:glutathione S-transferase